MKMVSGQTQRLVTVLLILTAVIPLSISCSSPLLNQAPIINSLNADKEQVNPSDSVNISCDARDPDRDQLTYTWSASGGTISGESPAVTWTAPQAKGAYTISVTVDDGKGGKATKEVSVYVQPSVSSGGGGSPPIIKSLTFEPATFKYDDEIMTLTCVAYDPNGLEITSYTWEAIDHLQKPAGSFAGTGAVVKWTPPTIPYSEDCSISVYCTDSAGNRSGRKFIAVTVLCDCLRPEVSK